MYDFVNDWSPLPFGLQHKPHWSTPSKYLEKTWKVFDQSKDCFMSQDLEEENCKCTSHAKTARRRRLRSKSGFYLTVMPNGQVLGVKDPTSSYSKWIIFALFRHSVGNLIQIRKRNRLPTSTTWRSFVS